MSRWSEHGCKSNERQPSRTASAVRVTLEPAPHQSLFTLLPKHSRFFAPSEMLWSFAASNRWAALSHGMRHSFHRNKNHVSKLETTQLSIYPYKIESTSGGEIYWNSISITQGALVLTSLTSSLSTWNGAANTSAKGYWWPARSQERVVLGKSATIIGSSMCVAGCHNMLNHLETVEYRINKHLGEKKYPKIFGR